MFRLRLWFRLRGRLMFKLSTGLRAGIEAREGTAQWNAYPHIHTHTCRAIYTANKLQSY